MARGGRKEGHVTNVVEVYGVQVSNPTGVWHEIMNARANLMDGKRWLSGGWAHIEGSFRKEGYSMCLANVLRYVVSGRKDEPQEHVRNGLSDMYVAEKVVFAAVRRRWPGRDYDDIPGFNDSDSVGWPEIEEVMLMAANELKPHAFKHTVTMARDVMTPAEREEMDALGLQSMSWSWWSGKKKGRNRARDARGRFTRKEPTTMGNIRSVPALAGVQRTEGEFKEWLDSFDTRGWDLFWDELLDCTTPECERARKELMGV